MLLDTATGHCIFCFLLGFVATYVRSQLVLQAVCAQMAAVFNGTSLAKC